MDLKDLIIRNRSYRRFVQKERVPLDMIRELVNRCRFVPSAANLQPLRFMIVYNPEKCDHLFSHLRWAAYLSDWPGPKEGERPSAYIVLLIEGKIGPFTAVDVGISLQTILLSATELGFGGCAFGSFDRDGLRSILGISSEFELFLVIALGKPKEKIVLETVKNNEIKYWRDTDQVHHVPKRKLEDILLKVFE